ncbi:MAG: hypothetical protein EZS28_009252, partial [Streblomastix strix]
LAYPCTQQKDHSFEGPLSVSHIVADVNPLVNQLDSVKVEDETFTCTLDKASSILFDPVISKGITRFEVLNVRKLQAVGIADVSVKYKTEQSPESGGWDKLVEYYWMGDIKHVGDWITSNVEFKTGDRVTMELNMETIPRSLTFFVNFVEQPLYIVNLPAAVRFWAYLLSKEECFRIIDFGRLLVPRARHGKTSCALDWGKRWKKKY